MACFWSATLPTAVAVTLGLVRDASRHAFGLVRVWGTVGFLVMVVAFPPLLDWLQRSRGLVPTAEISEPGLEVVWGPERVHSSTYSASPVVVDGRIYVTNEAGLTTVVSTADTFEILAENDVGEYTLSSLAVADGQVFLRTADYLYRIETKD